MYQLMEASRERSLQSGEAIGAPYAASSAAASACQRSLQVESARRMRARSGMPSARSLTAMARVAADLIVDELLASLNRDSAFRIATPRVSGWNAGSAAWQAARIVSL